jgi:hypothetical protein
MSAQVAGLVRLPVAGAETGVMKDPFLHHTRTQRPAGRRSLRSPSQFAVWLKQESLTGRSDTTASG